MTLVIALVCRDGVILASDSQATEATGAVRRSDKKVFELTDRALWGASGMGQVIRDIGTALAPVRPTLEAAGPNLGQMLSIVIKPQLTKHYSNYVHVPMTNPNPPQTLVLACGFSPETGGWIVEVDQNCQYSYYTDNGFHAIGSAAGFAQLANALMAHFHPMDKPLGHGKLIAYRAVDAAIKTSAYNVGPPIQMSVVDATGVHELSVDELKALENSVGGWVELESETLNDYLREPLLDAQPALPEPIAPEPAMPEEMEGQQQPAVTEQPTTDPT
jgi:proteasome beta subunit